MLGGSVSDDATMKAQLELDLRAAIKNIRDFATETGGAVKGTDELSRAVDKAEDALNSMGKSSDKASGSMSTGTAQTKKYAEGFEKLLSNLRKVEAAQQQVAQGAVVRDSKNGTALGDGTGIAETRKVSTADLEARVRVDNAASQNEMANTRKVLKERSDAIAKSISGIERESAARTAAYTKAFNEARSLDSGIANGQSDKRYATPTPASRNSASAGGKAEAQAEYAAQATRQYSAALKANAEAHNKVYAAAHAEALAINQVREAQGSHTESMIAARYALYDVATTYGVVSAALLTASALALKTGANFESSFTNVERTSEGTVAQISGLRDALLDLSTEVPLTFDELSKIAALGNQLGVAAADIEGFTGTIARFSAVSGMTAEATAQAFGRISNILGEPIENAEKLGSAIALVARSSASTETEIIGLAERLGATATRAGLTTDQVIGLAGALGSLGVAPERAQGVFETYFNTLNEAVAAGGKDLQNFATVTGLTTDAIETMVRSGQGFEVFERFLSGLQGADTVDLTDALGELGLSGLRANEVIGRITDRLPLLRSAFDDASTGYSQGTELARQYALVVDDLNTKFMTLVNAVNALIAEVSGGSLDGVGSLVQVLVDVTNAAREFVGTPLGQQIAVIGTGLAIAVGGFLAYRTAMILATASTLALRTATGALAGTGALGSLRGLAVAAGLYTVGANGATVATFTLSGALRMLGRVVVIGAVIGALSEIIFNFNNTARAVVPVLLAIQKVALDMGRSLAGVLKGVSDALGPLGGALSAASDNLNNYADFGTDVGKNLKSWLETLPVDEVADLGDNVDGAGASLGNMAGEAYGATGALDGLGDGAAAAAAEVRTLVDYAGDLSGVFARAFEIRFSADQGLDTVASEWSGIRQAISDTNDEIAEYYATINTLTADKRIKEYFRDVALAYKDSLRAGKYSAEVAEIDADLAAANKNLTKAQDKNTKSLVGNTDGAIENRAELLGLVGNYQKLIASYASSGMSQTDLQAKTAALKAEFVAQATQLGYSGIEVQKYAASFDDVATAIARVPRDVTVTANVDPAMQALNEFEARLRSMASNTYSGGTISTAYDNAGAAKGARAALIQAEIAILQTQLALSTNPFAKAGYFAQIAAKTALLNSGSFRAGGYTGNGGVDEEAGVVHGREFVFSAPAVKNIGVANLARMHEAAKRGSSPTANSGSGSQSGSGVGTGITELGPKSLARIDALVQRQVFAVLAASPVELAGYVREGESSNSFSGGTA